MTTELVSRRTVVVSWLLTSLCLRYGVAKPSVWLCRKACKLHQFNGFRSDYPLNLSCFGLAYWSVLERLHVPCFFVLRWETFRSFRKVSQSWLQSPGNIAGSWNDLAPGSLIRNHWRSSSRGRPLATPFPSEHAGPFLSPAHALRVAARECCLNLYRKSWLNLNTVARFTGAQMGHSGRTICWRVRLTRVTRKHTTVELRDLKQAMENDANSTVGRTRVCSRCPAECWRHRPQVHKGQKGTHHVSKSRSSKFHPAVYDRRYWLA